MKLHIPYPLLLITAIILDRIAISSAQIDFSQSLRVLLVLLLLTTLVRYLLQHFFIKDWRYTDFIVLMIPVTFLIYRSLYGFLKMKLPSQSTTLGLILIPLFGLLYMALVNRKVWQSIQNPVQVTAYFYLVFTLLVSFQFIRLIQENDGGLVKVDNPSRKAVSKPDFEIHLQKNSSPDIYVIVLDGYGRQDVLREIYEYDNSEFTDGLQDRGFYLATDSHSNYVQTPYTMASFWNLEYIQTWDSAYEYDQYLYQPIQDNRVFRALDEIGYKTVSTRGEVHYAEVRNSDVYASSFLPINDFETLLLVDSPIEPVSNIFDLRLPLQTYKAHRAHIQYQLETLKTIPAEIPGPKIVYAHILSPHPPFVFDQNGDIRESERAFTLAEGPEFSGGREQYINGYREQVKYINVEIMKVIDAILTTSETPPVIVIMGDHGPSSMFNFSVDDPGCIWERSSNLYAVLLPGHTNDGTLYPSISPVNTFRVIFNTYFGTDLQLLEDRSYLRFWQQPTLNLDITNQRDSLEGCTSQSNELAINATDLSMKSTIGLP